MRVTTGSFFDRTSGQMARLNQAAEKINDQIATGKKITVASDDPASFQRLAWIKRAGADNAAFAANITLAQGVLAQADSTLATMEEQLQRAKELTIQANSGILSDFDRTSIAVSIDSIVEDLLALSNAKDARGQPLFAGASGDTAFARQADGSIAYVGADDAGDVPIGEGVSVQVTENGGRVFGGTDGGADMFAVLQALSAALQAGGDISGAAGDALEGLDSAIDQTVIARSSVGARAYRLDFEADHLTDLGIDYEALRSSIEDTDLSVAITELQKTLTVLQATQASFTKLTGLSLFDYLR
ncbi:flagellar hook-associated protein FlgL [Sphingomonas japonica]|uniref:Flagellar hook-associated protein 3 FlgL n=1 Tax=Sphingomonas japonica TaxID=511662 RepID=A0ABX0U5E3_9SPHN|nr:flagellar hook-associated protein FlgL [Sphingomonas japonica]NIJ24002.1 flagellar hook-associated protein 3 FlgL [Sphingomonas japonica]